MRVRIFLLPLLSIPFFLTGTTYLQSQPTESENGQTAPLKRLVEQSADALTPPSTEEQMVETSASARIPYAPYENHPNERSNVELFVSNYGVIGLNVEAGAAGGLWPRGSLMRYIFGGGFWFGAMKIWYTNPGDASSPREIQQKSVISYNPNTGNSWFVPGVISTPLNESKLELTPEAINNYRLYSSLDYDPQTGEPLDAEDKLQGGPNWPIWDIDPSRTPGTDHYFGDYLQNPDERTIELNPEGPSIISDQDMVAVFKDTDLSQYEIGEEKARTDGYPLGIQVEQQVFMWETGKLKDVVIIRYRYINKSSDTLYNCYAAPVYDIDLGFHANDRMRTVIPNEAQDSLDMGVAWSEQTNDDAAYGYLGVDILQSPAVYPIGNEEEGFIRQDKSYYENSEQLGAHAFRNWIVDVDPNTPEERYKYMAEPARDGDNGGGDKKLCLSTGPFSMRPGDTAVVAVGLIFANGVLPERNGTWDDMKQLIDLDMYTQKVYDRVLKTSSVEGERAWRLFRELNLE